MTTTSLNYMPNYFARILLNSLKSGGARELLGRGQLQRAQGGRADERVLDGGLDLAVRRGGY